MFVSSFLPLLLVTTGLVKGQLDPTTIKFAYPGYEEPAFFQFYEDNIGAEYLLRCVRRPDPPPRDWPVVPFPNLVCGAVRPVPRIPPEVSCNPRRDATATIQHGVVMSLAAPRWNQSALRSSHPISMRHP